MEIDVNQSAQDSLAINKKSSGNALQRMLQPSSIAIVGASSDLNKVSGRPLKYLLDKGYKGAIYPINPRAQDIAGVAAVPDIAAYNNAKEKLKKKSSEELLKATGGMNLPFDIKFPL
jgi:hypothetical protein